MTIAVSENLTTIDPAMGKIGVIASAGGFAAPLLSCTNHLAGYKMGGLLHHQRWETDITTGSGELAMLGGTGRFYTCRAPNCDYLIATGYISTVSAVDASEVVFTAGTGDSVTVAANQGQRFAVAFPWGSADEWAEVTYAMTECSLRTISIWCLCRETLAGYMEEGDQYIDSVDVNTPGAGFNEGEYIIHDPGFECYNIDGLANAILDVRNNTIRQAVSWSDPGGAGAKTGTMGSWANPFEYSLTFPHTARWFTSSVVTKYRIYAYTKCADMAVGATYGWKVTTAAGSQTKDTLDNTSFAWAYIGDLDLVGSGTESTLTFEFYTGLVDASPTLTIAALSICQQKLT